MSEIIETLDGLILSDGNYTLNKGCVNAAYRHACKHYEYTSYVKELLQRLGFSFIGGEEKDHIRPYTIKETGRTYYYLHASVDPIFTQQYFRWYKDGKKVVPEDVSFSDKTLLQWFLGDGTVNVTQGRLCGIELCTHSFPRETSEYLAEKLTNLGFKTSVRSDKRYNHFYIAIWVRSCRDFLEFIGPAPVECYQYKWDKVILRPIRSQAS